MGHHVCSIIMKNDVFNASLRKYHGNSAMNRNIKTTSICYKDLETFSNIQKTKIFET
jgi:hypothetical protein